MRTIGRISGGSRIYTSIVISPVPSGMLTGLLLTTMPDAKMDSGALSRMDGLNQTIIHQTINVSNVVKQKL